MSEGLHPERPSDAKPFAWIGALLLLLAGTAPAFAVDVEPARLELTLPVDQPTEGDLEVTHHADKPVQIRIQSGAYRFLQQPAQVPSGQDWLSFEPAEFTLAPGVPTKVHYTVTPPPGARDDSAGEYVAAILIDELPVQSAAAPAEGAGQVAIVPRLALPVYLKIRGRERVEMEIAAVSCRALQSDRKGTAGEPAPALLKVAVTLKNLGTVHLRPSGTLAIFRGETLVRGSAMGVSLPLLPTAQLTVPTILPLPDAGEYRLIVTAEPQPGQILQKETSFQVSEDGQVR